MDALSDLFLTALYNTRSPVLFQIEKLQVLRSEDMDSYFVGIRTFDGLELKVELPTFNGRLKSGRQLDELIPGLKRDLEEAISRKIIERDIFGLELEQT